MVYLPFHTSSVINAVFDIKLKQHVEGQKLSRGKKRFLVILIVILFATISKKSYIRYWSTFPGINWKKINYLVNFSIFRFFQFQTINFTRLRILTYLKQKYGFDWLLGWRWEEKQCLLTLRWLYFHEAGCKAFVQLPYKLLAFMIVFHCWIDWPNSQWNAVLRFIHISFSLIT